MYHTAHIKYDNGVMSRRLIDAPTIERATRKAQEMVDIYNLESMTIDSASRQELVSVEVTKHIHYMRTILM